MNPLTRLTGLVSVDLPESKNPGVAAAEAAGEAFEAYMVAFLAKEMRASVPEGPFSSGPAAIFADLFDQEIGRRVASGPGMGLKAEIARALLHESPSAAPHSPVRHAGMHREGPVGASEIDLARITSGYGLRADPLAGGLRHHDGIDVGAVSGTPVRAAMPGIVRFAGRRGGYGNAVIVDHGGGVETRYAHCATLLVKAGAQVLAGEQLATVGSTGRATGPHLHFEVRRDGVAVDPAEWLEGYPNAGGIDLLEPL